MVESILAVGGSMILFSTAVYLAIRRYHKNDAYNMWRSEFGSDPPRNKPIDEIYLTALERRVERVFGEKPNRPNELKVGGWQGINTAHIRYKELLNSLLLEKGMENYRKNVLTNI